MKTHEDARMERPYPENQRELNELQGRINKLRAEADALSGLRTRLAALHIYAEWTDEQRAEEVSVRADLARLGR